MSQCSLRSRPMELFIVDISESGIAKDSMSLLNILLKDRTTKRNIKWASPSYKGMGKPFHAEREIRAALITGKYGMIIQPRVEKSKQKQELRTKKRAEVFTPAWLVDKQVSIVERETGTMDFNSYIRRKWLELACGEGPYMVTRYDSTTGDMIPVEERVGFMDRKLQRILKYTDCPAEFIRYAVLAYETSYGYELQGDSLLLARENLMLSFCEYYKHKFGTNPDIKTTKRIAQIISYNVVQMNGITMETPYSAKNEAFVPVDIFSPQSEIPFRRNCLATVKNWDTNEIVSIDSIARGEGQMKFDVVIGNPPYQNEGIGDNARDEPIYHLFIDSARAISTKSILITPARFLFNAGQTPDAWNERFLTDNHVKVVYYEQKSDKIFPNTDIKGGVAVTYCDSTQEFNKIGTFTPVEELNTILQKVVRSPFKSFNILLYGKSTYKFNHELYKIYPALRGRVSASEERSIASNIFEKLPEIFAEKQSTEHNIGIWGRVNNQRVLKWVSSRIIDEHPNLNKYKVLLPASNGSGAIGEVLSTPLIGEPLIGEPLIGHTQTFISFGAFDNKHEAENVLKYVKTKFLRTLLGSMKITQHNQSKKVWKNIPLQNFTSHSDIDWSQSVADIDKQLYAKYKLSQEEIDFIEEKVRAMD